MDLLPLFVTCSLAVLGGELLDAERAGAVVSHRATTCGQTATTSITMTKPAGTVAGDVLVASVGFAHPDATVANPSGWTQVPNLRGTIQSDQQGITWYKVAGSSEPSSYTFSGGSGTQAVSGSLSSFAGVDTTAPIADTPAQTIVTSLSTSQTLPNSTGAAVGSMRFSASFSDDGSSTSFSSGLTQVCNEDNEAGTDVSLGTAYETTGVGTTANRTVTLDDNARLILQTLVLAPMPCSTGGLNLTEPGSVSFPSVALDGTNKTSATSATLVVDDQTGSGSGWNLSATSTTFKTSGGATLPTAATTVTGVTPTAGSGRCAAPTNSIGYPVGLPAGTTAPPASKIYNAAATTGRGPTSLAFGLNLAVPASAKIGSYSSTWTFTLATGP